MSDNNDREKAFSDICRERKLLSPEELDECRRLRDQALQEGAHVTLAQIAVTQGYMKKQQAEMVYKAIEDERKTPMKIGGFEIIEKIGSGGMGTVFKARQVSMNRPVALKVLPPKLKRNKAYIERFRREAQAAARLNHPNIVHGIDAGEEQGFYYFAMEFVDGESLGDILEREAPLDELRALTVTLDVALALEHAGEINVVHRDIKPGNILITRKGDAKLSDLGLAKVQQKQQSFITQTGFAVGTPHYISPEQAQGKPHVDTRADIYSLGVTLYHMLAGDVPFPQDSPLVVMTKHLNEDFPPLEEKNPSLSPLTLEIVAKMTRKKLTERYQSATELIQDLEAARRELQQSRERSGIRIADEEEISAAAATLPEHTPPPRPMKTPAADAEPSPGSASRAPFRASADARAGKKPDPVEVLDQDVPEPDVAMVEEVEEVEEVDELEEVGEQDDILQIDEPFDDSDQSDEIILRQQPSPPPTPSPAAAEPAAPNSRPPTPSEQKAGEESASAIDQLRSRMKQSKPESPMASAKTTMSEPVVRVNDWFHEQILYPYFGQSKRAIWYFVGMVVLACVLMLIIFRLFLAMFSGAPSDNGSTAGAPVMPQPANGSAQAPVQRPEVPAVRPRPDRPEKPDELGDDKGSGSDILGKALKLPGAIADRATLPRFTSSPPPGVDLPPETKRKLDDLLLEVKLKCDEHHYGAAKEHLTRVPEELRGPKVSVIIRQKVQEVQEAAKAYVDHKLARAARWAKVDRYDEAFNELKVVETGMPLQDARVERALREVERAAVEHDLSEFNFESARARCNVDSQLEPEVRELYIEHARRLAAVRDQVAAAIRETGSISLPIVGKQKARSLVPPVDSETVTLRESGSETPAQQLSWGELDPPIMFAAAERALGRDSARNSINLAILAAYLGLERQAREVLVQAEQLKAPEYVQTRTFIEGKFARAVGDAEAKDDAIVSRISRHLGGGPNGWRYVVMGIAAVCVLVLVLLARKVLVRK